MQANKSGALPGLGTAMAFPGWLAVVAETPRKRQTAFSSFFFAWLPVNKNTFFKKRQPYLVYFFFFLPPELLQENL